MPIPLTRHEEQLRLTQQSLDACFERWAKSPDETNNIIGLAQSLDQYFNGGAGQKYDEPVMAVARTFLKRVTRHIAENEITVSRLLQNNLLAFAAKNNNWQAFTTEENDQFLLAALTLTGSPTYALSASDYEKNVESMLSGLTGAAVRLKTSQDAYRKDVAERLFGGAWAALYAGDLAQPLPAVYSLLQTVRPPFLPSVPPTPTPSTPDTNIR